jgi:CRISPR-associated protein Cmr1
MKMIQRHYTVRFLTPAFLGNAEQAGEWRTPPFKHLLREWWRVAVAKECNYNVETLRAREAALFGVAADGESRQSRVRIRLDKWGLDKSKELKSAPAIGSVTVGKNSLPAALYSGYGPVIAGPRLKASAAIQAGDSAPLRLAYEANSEIERALALLHRFGTLGGRSRNGWGSLELQGESVETDLPLVDWRGALKLDWAHGIGKDNDGALIWESRPQSRWEDAMRLLAQLRADMRRKVNDRLLLAYPSTKASMPGWKNTDRVPHSLRFKVRAEDEQFVATVFHLPCRPADELWKRLAPGKQRELPECFEQAHRFLDSQTQLTRTTI